MSFVGGIEVHYDTISQCRLNERVYLRPFPGHEVPYFQDFPVSVGEEVRVVGQGDKWSKIGTCQGFYGWVLTKTLSISAETVGPGMSASSSTKVTSPVQESMPLMSLAPPLPKRNPVAVFSLGIERYCPDLTQHCNDERNRGIHIPYIQPKWLQTLLRQHSEVHADVVADCRWVKDPDDAISRWHIGAHPSNIRRFCMHAHFRSWLQRVKKEFEKASRNRVVDGSPLCLVVYCKSGKHRSVSAAILIQHILGNEGWECRPLEHLSRQTWGPKNRCCWGLCPECQEKTVEYQDTLNHVLELWRSLSHEVIRIPSRPVRPAPQWNTIEQ